jgi:hypothetical protein
MEDNMSDNLKMVNIVAKERIDGLMEDNTLDNGQVVKEMVKGH